MRLRCIRGIVAGAEHAEVVGVYVCILMAGRVVVAVRRGRTQWSSACWTFVDLQTTQFQTLRRGITEDDGVVMATAKSAGATLGSERLSETDSTISRPSNWYGTSDMAAGWYFSVVHCRDDSHGQALRSRGICIDIECGMGSYPLFASQKCCLNTA
jgi:hypothetical protein